MKTKKWIIPRFCVSCKLIHKTIEYAKTNGSGVSYCTDCSDTAPPLKMCFEAGIRPSYGKPWKTITFQDCLIDFQDAIDNKIKRHAWHLANHVCMLGLVEPTHRWFNPAYNKAFHDIIVKHKLIPMLRRELYKDLTANKIYYEAEYCQLTLDNLVTTNPNKEWFTGEDSLMRTIMKP
jgi:hypothetical protein